MQKPLIDALVNALAKSPTAILPAGTRIFHGCTDQSKYTDWPNKKLSGTRKWFSAQAHYAVDYAYSYNGLGTPLLWEGSLVCDTIGIIARQFPLHHVTPWGSAFPFEFPNEFLRHAQAALQSSEHIVLLDHPTDEQPPRYGEILVSAPTSAVEINRIYELPGDQMATREWAQKEFPL